MLIEGRALGAWDRGEGNSKRYGGTFSIAVKEVRNRISGFKSSVHILSWICLIIF